MKRGRKAINKYATIDPTSYEVSRTFDTLTELENYLNLKSPIKHYGLEISK